MGHIIMLITHGDIAGKIPRDAQYVNPDFLVNA
jgi:hypothetical protein